MNSNTNPNQPNKQNEPVQPGLDPSKTGKPNQSDPRTDQKPGQEKQKGNQPGHQPQR